MLNRRWLTAWRLFKSGEYKELLVRLFKVFSNSFVRKTQIDYLSWREKWVELTEEEEIKIRKKMDSFSNAPTFRILLRANTLNYVSLFSTIESVKSQIYPKWILKIENLDEVDPDISEKIKSIDDDRIRISDFIDSQTEEWIIELESDVCLHKAALFDVAFNLINSPEIKIVFSDHDHVDTLGNFRDPHMKPLWNAELFSSINYMAPFIICENAIWNTHRKNHLNQHDFLLEATKNLSSENILHIPRILSTIHIVDDTSHLKPPVKNRVKKFESDEPMVSILIPTRDRGKMLEKCLESLFSITNYSHFEIVLIDHESSESKAIDVINRFNENQNFNVKNFYGSFNFSAMMNTAAAVATGEVLVLLNNDTEIVEPDWLKEIVLQVADPKVGIVGALLLFSDGTIQHAGIHPGIDGLMGHGHKHWPSHSSGYFNRLLAIHEVAAVTGACLGIKKKTWEALGGLDEENLTVAYNDVDLCLKARESGLKVILNPFSKIVHHESVSRGIDDTPERNKRLQDEIAVMWKRWGEKLNFDPAYNPNLSLKEGGFKLAETPRCIPFWKK